MFYQERVKTRSFNSYFFKVEISLYFGGLFGVFKFFHKTINMVSIQYNRLKRCSSFSSEC